MRLARLAAIAWKDAVEFYRDKRTVALMALSAFLLPILGVMVAGFKTQQEAYVAIVVCDRGSAAYDFASGLAGEVNSTPGLHAKIVRGERSECSVPTGYVLAVVIPQGFTDNATSLDRPIVIKMYKLVGSAAASDAENVVWSFTWRYSQKIARERVERLASMAHVSVDVNVVLHPLRVVSEAVTEKGIPASKEVVEAAEVARFLAFSIFFILNPAAIAVADAVAREREMGTGEIIAVTPVSGIEFVVGKAVGGIAAAAVAASLDMPAALAYLKLLRLPGSLNLALFHSVQVAIAVNVTVSITVLATLLIPGRRAATLAASVVSGVATMVFFASLFIDYARLPTPLKAALYLIPYTHNVEAMLYYALGEEVKALLHTLLLVAVSAAATIAAAKAYRPDRLVKKY